MAFTSTIISQTVMGHRKVNYGTFTNTDGSSGGDIDTGIRTAETVTLQIISTSEVLEVGASHLVNEDMPCNGRAVTVVTSANACGTWVAVGY